MASDSPYREISAMKILDEDAYVFQLLLDPIRLLSPIQVNVDGYPGTSLADQVFIRIRSQGGGCTFACKTCDAKNTKQVINLTCLEIGYQVVDVVRSPLLSGANLNNLTISFTGLGEPFANKQIIQAIEWLHKVFPWAKFIVSTTGPKSSVRMVDELTKLFQHGIDIELQLSIHSLDQVWRLDFIGDKMFNGAPLKSITLETLSNIANRWLEVTGRKVHANFAIGPDFNAWNYDDYMHCMQLFPPDTIICKLSLEGSNNGISWNSKLFLRDLDERKLLMEANGYKVFCYIPPGIDSGGSCGTEQSGKIFIVLPS